MACRQEYFKVRHVQHEGVWLRIAWPMSSTGTNARIRPNSLGWCSQNQTKKQVVLLERSVFLHVHSSACIRLQWFHRFAPRYYRLYAETAALVRNALMLFTRVAHLADVDFLNIVKNFF